MTTDKIRELAERWVPTPTTLYPHNDYLKDLREKLVGEIRNLLSEAARENGWRPIESAPKDGTEIIGYREDAGAFLIRYTAPVEFMTEREYEQIGESAEISDWFYADFLSGGRLEGDEAPTHWQPLPLPPAPPETGVGSAS